VSATLGDSVVAPSAANGVVQLSGLAPRRTASGWELVVARGILSLPDHWVRQGSLTLGAVLKLRADGLLTPKSNSSLPVTITPVTACNLRCPYCFQNEVNVTSARVERAIASEVMRPQTLDAVERFIRDRMILMGRTGIELLLFGGEPLLRPDLCAEIAGRFSAEQQGPVGLVTNGSLLSTSAVETLSGAAEWDIQISLDGAREDHDLLRSRRNRGTYEDIVENLARAQRVTGWDWHLRINCTSDNVARLTVLLDDLARRIDVDQTNIDFAPVEDLGVGFSTRGFTETSLRQLTEAVEYAHQIGFQLAPPSSLVCGFCGNGKEHGIVVGPDGTLFSCWDDVGYLDRAVGNVADGYAIHPNADRWHKCGYAAEEDMSAVNRILNEARERLISLAR
jgi:uncharacterized protein